MNDNNELVNDWSPQGMLEVVLDTPDDFLKVKETLTRMGIASKRDKTLFQSCHILHKQGRYFIVHFKEMFMLDGRASDFTIEDRFRRNLIATLLSDWGLLRIASEQSYETSEECGKIKIIPFKEKNDWNLKAKYSIGNVKK